ncbi:hypothetical protein FRC02_005669 [Tulasnella sp. 418]|nr:hypothetical protein FRC02_005669 [Tulasnella sp. 418]
MVLERLSLRLVFLAILSSVVSAQHEHGSDSGSPGVMMIPFLHFTPGDALWFKEWVPRSKGPIVGACIGLFMLAILERFLAGTRGVMESWWRRKTEAMLVRKYASSNHCGAEVADSSISTEGDSAEKGVTARISTRPAVAIRRVLPPFIPSHDFTRAAMQVVQSAISYTLMLAVMTFNASFIISILVGVFCGELMFGRFATISGHS